MTTFTWEARDAESTDTTPAVPSGPPCRQRAGLEIDLVSAEFLEISAHGPLTADRRQEVEDRLADLVACGTDEVRLSLADVPLIAPSLAAVLVETADAVRSSGRTFRLTEVPLCLVHRLAERIQPGYRSTLAHRLASSPHRGHPDGDDDPEDDPDVEPSSEASVSASCRRE